MTVPHIYCLTFRNPVKRQRIISRLQLVGLTMGLHVELVEGIAHNHPSICVPPEIEQQAREMGRYSPMAWSCIHGHLLIIDKFLASGADMAIVMEDDVMISLDFVEEIQQVTANFKSLNLDILLLGCLSPVNFLEQKDKIILDDGFFKYLSYDWNVYGTQMYLISRSYAQYVKHTFGTASGYGQRCLVDPNLLSFNADWIITKNGRRAMVYPMLAIEELGGGTSYNDPFQTWWHDHCHHSQASLFPNRWV